MDSVSENYMDSIITNLKILNIIHLNEKLSIRKGHLQIDKILFQSIIRWINKSSRDIIIIYLKDLIKNINVLIIKLKKYPNFKWLLTKIFTEMDKSKLGLLNLQTTYATDPVTVVKFENIITKFNELNLNYINDSYCILNETTKGKDD